MTYWFVLQVSKELWRLFEQLAEIFGVETSNLINRARIEWDLKIEEMVKTPELEGVCGASSKLFKR
jgi:hypothetical protein